MAALHDSVGSHVAEILGRALANERISVADAEILFSSDGTDMAAVIQVADALRRRHVGEQVTYVVNRNINYTNVCHVGCRFCAFSRRKNDQSAVFLTLNDIIHRATEAAERGATEVCIQGGLHPDIDGSHYRRIVTAIKRELPDIHIHAFSPFEIWYGAKKLGQTYRDFLLDLKECGLGSLPGTAAEIFDPLVRKRLSGHKLSTDQWIEIVETAHLVGIPTTATIMYGHIDGPSEWANHLGIVRTIQEETNGFTEFVPLGFVHWNTPLYLEHSDVRPGPTQRENLLMHAVARIFLSPLVRNIQVSWVKLGPKMAKGILAAGANDLGGTLIDESISSAAGGMHGQGMLPAEMTALIESTGRTPLQRDTLYHPLNDGAKDAHMNDTRTRNQQRLPRTPARSLNLAKNDVS